jgi:hypothetical protein
MMVSTWWNMLTFVSLVASLTQGCCTSATSMSQQGTSSHGQPFPLCGSRILWPKGGHNLSNGIGKGHDVSPWQERCLMPLSLPPEVPSSSLLSPHWTKTSSLNTAALSGCCMALAGQMAQLPGCHRCGSRRGRSARTLGARRTSSPLPGYMLVPVRGIQLCAGSDLTRCQ